MDLWGMTPAEAARTGWESKSFVAVLLLDEDHDNVAVGVLFIEAEAEQAFVADVDDTLEAAPAVKSLAKAVGAVKRGIAPSGPRISLIDR